MQFSLINQSQNARANEYARDEIGCDARQAQQITQESKEDGGPDEDAKCKEWMVDQGQQSRGEPIGLDYLISR